METLEKIIGITAAAVVLVGRAMLWFDKRVIKRYLGVETPLYRAWWRRHSADTQRRLNDEAVRRAGRQVFAEFKPLNTSRI